MISSSKTRVFTILLTSILILVSFPSAASAQTRTYRSKSADYILELPSPNWRAVKLSGIAHSRTEFIYGVQNSVHLRIRKELVDPGVSPADLVRRQQKWDSVYLRGYVIGQDESFDGRLSGAKYSYEYVTGGQPMAGMIYYLQANSRIIYRVEFTGSRDNLWELGQQTDFIARSFRLK